MLRKIIACGKLKTQNEKTEGSGKAGRCQWKMFVPFAPKTGNFYQDAKRCQKILPVWHR